ncbi:TolC family outer membrane protein [Daeguia caeni]|uniref:TolC family outer membrane protein n=1 Tax=Daeguia caeni TaxID=439612 RepID=A0ABV9HBK7_9HYPH
MLKACKGLLAAAALLSGTMLISPLANAETLQGALIKAYKNNASLNSARAGVRVQDENVPIAKSGYRPQITGSYSVNSTTSSGTNRTTGSFGIQLNQMLFDGFQTKNNVAAAETAVFAQRENLRNTEQNTLLEAVTAYMDVYMYRQIAALYEKNLAAMNEQVRAAQARLEVGEGTRTDVAQAQASRSSAIAKLNGARATLKSAEAQYLQVIGQQPDKLAAASAAKNLPKSPDEAFRTALVEHPGILATRYAVNAQGYDVKSKEGALLPGVGLSASASRLETYGGSVTAGDGNTASVGINVTIPIYTGGRSSALVRQSKEKLGQARIEVDVTQDKVRQAIAAAWSQLEAARANVKASRDGIVARQLALNGVIEERKVGQRTTLDVLNAQNDLVDAQIALVQAERDVVVASYALLNATGWLTVQKLRLNVAEYKPEEHYKAVKDKWIGLRTPDGR